MTITNRLPDRLELRQRQYILSRARRNAAWVAVALALLAIVTVVTLVFYLAAQGGRDPAVVLEALRARFASKPLDTVFHLLLAFAVALQVVYLRRAQKHERLILTRAGIEYRSPLPSALQTLRPNWSLAWGQIRSATLKSMLGGHGPQTVVLELDAGTRKIKIRPWLWVDPQHHQPASPWRELRTLQRVTAEETRAAIHDSAVLRSLAAALPQLAVQHGAGFGGATFALEKNPRTLALVIAFFALALYALADAALGHETYAGPVPVNAFVGAGLVAAVAAALWMRRGRVPPAETVIVALLFGAALGAAGYPGALRANALTDGDGLHKYEYRLTRERRLEPLTPGLPSLAFPDYYEYWEQFEPGSRHEFELRRGGLGFYQLNLQPLHAALREFYARRDHAPRRGQSSR